MDKMFVREAFIYGLCGVLSRFIMVFTAPIYTRSLTRAEYGLYNLCVTVATILVILAETGTCTGYVREYYAAVRNKRVRSLSGSVVVYNLASFALLLLVVLTVKQWLPGLTVLVGDKVILPIAVVVLPMLINDIASSLLRLERKAKLFLLFSMMRVLLLMGMGLYTVGVLKLGIPALLWSSVVAQSIMCIISFAIIVRFSGLTISLAYIRPVISFGFPNMISSLIGWIQSAMGRLFIAGALSLAILGSYSIAIKVAMIFLIMDMAFRQVWIPYSCKLFAIGGTERIIANVLPVWLYAGTVCVVVVTFCSPFIVRVLAPIEYMDAVPVIGTLCFAYFWNSATLILGAGNNWARKTWYNTISILASCAVSLAMLYFGTRRYGMPLVAASLLAGSLIKATLIGLTSQRNHYIPFARKPIYAAVAVTFLHAAGSYFVYEHMRPYNWVFHVRVFLALTIFLGIAWHLILPAPSRQAVLNYVNRQLAGYFAWRKGILAEPQ